MTVDRREFLKVATAGAGLTLAGATSAAAEPGPASQRARKIPQGQAPEVVVIGAGSFGMWTALHLNRWGRA